MVGPCRLRVLVGCIAVATLLVAAGGTASAQLQTDINMAIGLDRSESVDQAERGNQAEALVAALTDERFLNAIRAGWHGRIGLSVFTWSSFNRTRPMVPWMVVANRADAEVAVGWIRDYQRLGPDTDHGNQTDIALALGVGTELLRRAPFQSTKNVLNIVSDGIDNFGRQAFLDRDTAVGSGITVNGLVHARGAAVEIVEEFFRREVIGGPYAFVQLARSPEDFSLAMLRKMLFEVAQLNRSSRPDGAGSMAVPRG